MRNAAEYDPLGRMHHFWLGLTIVGLIALLAALAAALSHLLV